MNSMTDATIEINNPERVIKPSDAQLAKEAAEQRAKQLVAEEKAAQDARDELLKPEVVDMQAIQTSDIETQKLAGVLDKIQREDKPESE